MYYAKWYNVSRYYTLDHDSFTLEHNGTLKWQFLPEVKTLRGDKATKFSGQPFLVTVVNDSSSVSVSMAAFISEKVLRNWYKLCLSHARLHFGWWPCVIDIPSVLFSVFIVIGWKEIRLAKRICNMHLVTLTLSSASVTAIAFFAASSGARSWLFFIIDSKGLWSFWIKTFLLKSYLSNAEDNWYQFFFNLGVVDFSGSEGSWCICHLMAILKNASSKTIQRGVTLNHILFLRSIKLKHWSVGLRRALLSLGTIQGLPAPLKNRFASWLALSTAWISWLGQGRDTTRPM